MTHLHTVVSHKYDQFFSNHWHVGFLLFLYRMGRCFFFFLKQKQSRSSWVVTGKLDFSCPRIPFRLDIVQNTFFKLVNSYITCLIKIRAPIPSSVRSISSLKPYMARQYTWGTVEWNSEKKKLPIIKLSPKNISGVKTTGLYFHTLTSPVNVKALWAYPMLQRAVLPQHFKSK